MKDASARKAAGCAAAGFSVGGAPAVLLTLLAALSCGRILALHGVFWDDNCWLLSVYQSHDLAGFLDTGFRELRRVPQGVFLYGLFSTHALLDQPLRYWQAANLLVQVLTPLALFSLVALLPGATRLAAFAAACSLLVEPLDLTLPVFSNAITRVGLLLALVSLWATAKAARSARPFGYFAVAFVTAVVTNYCLAEAALALEPGRFLLLVWLGRVAGATVRDSIKRASLVLAPFLLAYLPLVFYKIVYPSYGLYAGYYPTDAALLFNPKLWKAALRHLCFGEWWILSRFTDEPPLLPGLLGIGGGLLGWWALSGRLPRESNPAGSSPATTGMVALGLTLLAGPLLFYLAAGKVPGVGFNGRHGILMQPGLAIALGAVIAALLERPGGTGTRKAGFALFLCVGVFFHNVNLDQYFRAWRYRQGYWQAFTKRFSVLPERADFLFDFDSGSRLYPEYAYYDYEFPLHLLYARSAARGGIIRYRVVPADRYPGSQPREFALTTNHGRDVFDSATLIPVAYRRGRLYVGQEVAELKEITYRELAGNPVPEIAADPPPRYPLRKLLPGFSE